MHMDLGGVDLNKMISLTLLMLVLGACTIHCVTESEASDEAFSDTIESKACGSYDEIVINASVPEVEETLPYYKVLKEDKIHENVDKVIKPRGSLPSEEEAVKIANEFLDERNYLLEGAYISFLDTYTIKTINEDTNTVEKETPVFVRVSYNRNLDSYPVVGPGDSMEVCIGENEEIVYFFKTWREVEKAGEVSIIDANSAIEKLRQNETVEKLAGSEKYPIEINEIEIGYYSETTGKDQSYYKPVWIFRGKDGLGYDIVRCVEAT
ncbi:hypothetical protein [Methanosarcina sp. WH1]|uniref:hypothetical protein n=2 Tax=unclassified Methanosarcina TaxID=2644672 RepID=UPI00064EAC82|nr:hypothetical protein [Methanosarcina sp. WH1]